MLQVVRAYDRAPIAEVETDDAGALETKLAAAAVGRSAIAMAGSKPHERIDILRRLAALMNVKREHFSRFDRPGGRKTAERRSRGGHARNRRRPQCRRRIAEFRRAGDPDGADGGQRRPLGIHDQGADRGRRRDLGLQSSAEPDRASGRAGNRHRLPVIVKPASATPLSLLRLRRLWCAKPGLPEPWCQTFLPRATNWPSAMATDPRIAFLSFIGSARVGWYLHGKLAHGTRSALEHGGAAPVIVDRQRRSRRDRGPAREGRLLSRRASLRVGAAHLRPCLRAGPFRRALHRGGGGAEGRRSAVAGDGGRPADPAEGGRPRDVLDRGGQGGGRGGRDRRHTSLRDNGCADRYWSNRQRTRASRARRCSAPSPASTASPTWTRR